MAARLTTLAAASALALIVLIGAAPGSIAAIGATIYSIRPDGTQRTLVLRLDPPVYLVLQSQDGQKIVFSRDLRLESMYVSDISGANPVKIQPAGYPSFSPDATRLAVTNEAGLWVVNNDGTRPHRVADYGGHASWSPDGRRVAYVVGAPGRNVWGSTIHVVDAEGGPDTYVARGLNAEWAPRGNRIAYLALRRGYAVPCFADSDGSHRTCYRGFSVNGQFVWSPDGTRIAFRQASPSRITVVTADGRHILRFPVLTQRVRELAWSPDGRWLAYSKDLAGPDHLFIRPVRPRGGERLVTSEAGFSDVHWLPGRITYVLAEYRP
jgi:Tol biopolymer transport system component